MELYKADGTPADRNPRGLKIRLADTFKRPGQATSELLKEIHALSDHDLADFRAWFEAAGYPCTATPGS